MTGSIKYTFVSGRFAPPRRDTRPSRWPSFNIDVVYIIYVYKGDKTGQYINRPKMI